MKTSLLLSNVRVLITVLTFSAAGLAPVQAGAPGNETTLRHSGQTAGSVVVNEFMASNQTGLQDEDGDRSDWIELSNPGSTPISLAGWSLSDDPTEPGKWVFPARTLPVNGYLVIFASNKNRAPPSGQLHTNFRLSASGEYLGLFDNSTPRQVVDEFSPQFPPQYGDISYGRYNTPQTYRYFANPTPGAGNDFASAYLGVVADVSFQYPRGYYDSTSLNVALETSTSGASIRHSRTGYAPSATTGTVYSGPVNIYDSMPLRAIAYKSGYLSSPVGTHSYLMPSKVALQPAAPSGFPTTWGWYNGQQVPADYEMDPAVVNDPRYAGTIRQDLRSLPAISIAARRVDLFDEWQGIYSNPTQTGDEWERPASVELIHPDSSTGFQVDAGLRIHGNITRRPSVTPKHSLRLHFRGDYGTPELNYPLFPDTEIDSFEVIVLRAMYEDTWLYNGNALYVRDQWMRDTQLAMGWPGAHGRFVHVYLDGLYWGIYNLIERLDDHFAASYFGGTEADYDIIVPSGPGYVTTHAGNTDAWNAMMAIANAGLASPSQYAAIQQYLDVPNLIDYMITHIYAATGGDWLVSAWTAIRKREPGAGFQFFCWDNEGGLHSLNGDITGIGFDESNNPAYLYHLLRDNPEFRLLFADHVHRHFFNGGTLYVDPANPQWDPAHPERNVPAARLARRIDEVDRAVVPESARWGDGALNSTARYTRNDHWVVERNWALNTLLSQRSAIVLQQLRDVGLYPNVVAPAFSQHGGSVPAGFLLSMAVPSGVIYFTTDGSDPRVPISGAVSPNAIAYAAPLALPGGVTTVIARALNGSTWSALNEATFEAPQDWSTLKLTEIMYNPLGGSAYEFMELKNIGSTTLNLAGVHILDAVEFTFPDGDTLGPGQFTVLINDDDPLAFATRYPGVPVAGHFIRDLSNGGETITWLDPLGGVILSVQYDDAPPWPTAPDGLGYSLVIVDPLADPTNPANWRASAAIHGSPGADDPPPTFAGIVINELLAHSDPPFEDAIELRNLTNAPVDIGGWFLSDDANSPTKFRIPDGTTLSPGGFVVFYEYQFNPTPGIPPSFGLSSTGERLFLFAADPGGALTGYADSVQFDASPTNTALGRFETSTAVRFTLLSRPTFGVENPASVQQFRTGTGAANAYPLVGPLVINELMYNPPTGGHEFIELRNITNAPLPLYDPDYPANTWRFSNGIGFDFPPNAAIPPHGLALVVPIDPAAFAAAYNVPAGVPVFGPYSGALDNGGETIALARPDAPNGATVPYIPVDSVTYDDVAPWPTEPDGSGPSLERLSGPTFADDPVLWQASPSGGTPGRPNNACHPADVHPNKDHAQPALCDNDVDIADLQSVAACWNRPLATAGCPPTLNLDGVGAYISVGDIIASASYWGWRP
jgi:hypothetical protein